MAHTVLVEEALLLRYSPPPKEVEYMQMFRRKKNVVSEFSAMCIPGYFLTTVFMSATNLLSLNVILLIIASRVAKYFILALDVPMSKTP